MKIEMTCLPYIIIFNNTCYLNHEVAEKCPLHIFMMLKRRVFIGASLMAYLLISFYTFLIILPQAAIPISYVKELSVVR